MSAIKREAVVLYEQLRVVEMKRDELVLEEQERGTPGQVSANNSCCSLGNFTTLL